MESRSIPPLKTNYSTHILQVNAIIRHGSRTPWTEGLHCWSGYDEGDSSRWDCSLNALMAPPATEEGAKFLFEKRYDALKPPQGNVFGGTCQKGQLLQEGYDQELANGRILRSAYVTDARWHPSNGRRLTGRLHLYAGVTKKAPYDDGMLWFRGDDEERTLMSGEVLIRGLFGDEIEEDEEDVVIQIHTGDKSRDVLNPNAEICPRLKELEEEAWNSAEYQSVNASTEAMELRSILNDAGAKSDKYGFEPMNEATECLMTTMCTDRILPEKFDDYGKDNSLFDRLHAFSSFQFFYPYVYSKAQLAKLAMGPLWAEIMEKIDLTVQIKDSKQEDRAAPRLAIYSGHDTTLAPLLASLGLFDANVSWVPYASMLIIEIHSLLDNNLTSHNSTKRLFRLLYNGKVLTPHLEGCPPEEHLCDLQVLDRIVRPFATRDRNCAVGNQVPAKSRGSYGTGALVLAVLLACACGGLTPFLFTRTCHRTGTVLDEDKFSLTGVQRKYGTTRGNGAEAAVGDNQDWTCEGDDIL